jgi:acylphosphatase
MPTVHLLVKGRVQGVSFRASAKEEADQLSITGWVRNTPEGHVEITATGNDAALKAFTTWCRRGPAHAHVTELLSEPLPETPFPNFSIRRS